MNALMNGKIYLPRRKISKNSQGTIKLTPEAMDALVEAAEESGLSVRQAASMIITQAVQNNLIEYGAEEDDE